MAQTMEDYRSRTTMAGYRRRKRLEQQIGLDTYSADLSRFAESVGDGGSAYLDEASFVGARQNAEALLGRTEALREYMRLYGGDATGLEETSKWLTGRRDYLGGFSDFSRYQAQRAQYERESQNYDFEGAANRLQGLRERLDAIPSGFKGTMQDVGTALSNFVNGFFANGEQRDLHADHRSALESEIAALENEMARARVYAVRDTAALPGFDWFSKAKTTNRKGIAFGADGSDGVDWQHEYINGDGDRSAGTWYFDQVASDPYRSIRLDSFQEMSEEELARYNYLYNTQGRDAAQQYLNGIYDTLYSRTVQRIARLSGKHPVLGTLLSLGGSTMGAVEELGSILTGTMEESNISTDFGEAAQSGVASNINSDFGAFLYNTGVSALQSAATGLLFGHAGGVVLGLSAMASTRNDLLRRGADAATATKAGLAAGVFEGLFETLSLGTLPALKEVPVNSLKDLVLNIAKSTGVNASEEMATDIANVLYDTFANGDFSAAQQMLDAGMSKAEVAKRLWMQIAEAAASGAVMGLGFGGIGSGVAGLSNAATDAHVGKAIKAGDSAFGGLSSLTALGDKYGLKKQTAAVANKGQKASNRTVGNLYRRVGAAIAGENRTTATAAIEARMTALGVAGEKAKRLAPVVLKKYMRQSLSPKESVMLDRSKAARQALGELMGDGNAKWANQLIATLSGENNGDMATVSAEDVAMAAQHAAQMPRSAGAQVQVAENGTVIGELPQIAAVGENGVTLVGTDGEVALDDTAMPEEKALLYSLAGLFPSAEVANGFINNWDGRTAPDRYFQAYQLLYTYGRNQEGYSNETVLQKGKEGGLTDAQSLAAFKSGIQSISRERRMAQERLDGIIQQFREKGTKRAEGRWDDQGIRGLDLKKLAREHAGLQDVEQFVAFLRLTTKAFGWNVRMIADRSERRSNGSYDPATNTLTFNIYSGTTVGTELVRTAMPNTISHEAVHWMKQNAPEQYAALEKVVFAALQGESDYDFAAALLREYGKYKERYGREITDTQAREEIVARACEDLLGRSEAIQKFLADFAEQNKEAATGFAAAVKRVLVRIKEFFENLMFGANSRTLEAGIIRRCGTEVVDGLMAQYEKTFMAALEGNAARNAVGKNEQGSVRYSLNENAAAELHKALYDISYLEEVLLRDKTPTIMMAQKGVRDLPMAMNVSHIRENVFGETEAQNLGLRVDSHTHYHGLGEAFFLQIIDGLDSVTEAYRGTKNASNSARRENYFLLVSKFKDKDGNVINVPVYINEHAQFNRVFVDVNKISTAFGREDFYDYIKRQIKAGNLVRIKNRSTSTSEPDALIAPRYGRNASAISIAQNSEMSTPSGQEIFSDGSQEVHSDPADEAARDDAANTPKITVGMSDAERAAILKKKYIVAPIYSGQAEETIAKEPDLESNKFSLVKAALVRIGEEFGVFTDYNIRDVEIKITLSKGNLRESISKDATPAQLARLLPLLRTAVENAVGIESHQNRYYYDTYTTSFDNLLGGYEDGDCFVPVRFGLKHGINGETTLYVVIDQTKIETEVLKTAPPQNVKPSGSRSVSVYSIAQIVPFVNSKDLLRYLPDDMLNTEQKKAKWESIADTIQYTNEKNDKRYARFVAEGKLDAAIQMIEYAAKANGYTIEAYHGTNNREEHSVWNAERREWETSYTPITVFRRQYDEQVGHFFSADKKNAGGYGSTVYSVFLMLKNPLVIECSGQGYNSISFDGKEMDTYEWAAYARKHRYDGVIFKDVRDGVGLGDLSELTTDYVVFDSNRIKSADPITYDKNGNVIPISQRFNVRERDIRYSDPEDDARVPAFSEGAILTALWDAMDHRDAGDDNLIRMSRLPRYVTEMFGIEGDFYIYRDHAYENMVSEEQAVADGRPVRRKGRDIHFHDLGMEKMTSALMSLEYPIIVIDDTPKAGNPQVVMMLTENGNNGAPLYAALSFYSDRPIKGRFEKRPHIVLTVAERAFLKEHGYASWEEVVREAIIDGRVLDFDKNKRTDLSVIAQRTSLGNITEGSLKDSIARFRKKINTFKQKNNISYSDPADDVQSDREILTDALLDAAQNEIERNALRAYQQNIKRLDRLHVRLREVNIELRGMMFRQGPRDEAYTQQLNALKTEKERLEKEISKWDRTLLKLEATKSLQALLDREKQRTARLWADAGRKALHNYREQQLCRMYMGRIEDRAKKLRQMLLENSEKHHIPDAFKKPVAAFLSLLDFSSERALQGGELTQKDKEIQAAFAEVVTLLESLTDENGNEYLAGLDLPPDAVADFKALAEEVAQMAIDGREGGVMVLRRMSSEQLKALNSTLYAMSRAVRQVNELFANERFHHVSELALDFIGKSERYAAREKRSKISDFLQWENMVPYYAFRRLGSAGEALFKSFMRGQDTFAFLVKEIIDFTDTLYTKKEVKDWCREVHTFDGTNGKVYITTAQIMSLYELWKDKDARQHILGGGGRIQDIHLGIQKKYANDPNGTTLNAQTVDAMFAKLTPRQKAVADSLQKFMAEECAKWGNEVSYKRWGIKLFGLDYYFPIESDQNTTAAEIDRQVKESGLFSLLHKSFTKKRAFRANNRIMIRSVFDVFASHTTDMAKYHAFALPLLDMQRFINFKEIVPTDPEGEAPDGEAEQDTSFTTREVRASMEKAFGTGAYDYIKQFLKDLNGDIGGRSAAESVLQKGISAHKIAAVANNLRVAFLQPTAYVRLLNVMMPEYVFGGMAAGGHLKACMEKMQKYAGIALWKSLGYRDANIAAPVQTKIKHDETWRDKATEKSMIPAEIGDKVTWGAIWYACELETRGKRTDLKVGSEEYYRAVADRFTEVIYATQVVDSVFTRSQLMRKKDFFATLFTSFMSEPTLSYNLLAANALSLADAKRSGERITKEAVKPLVRAVGVFAIGAVIQAAVESLIDAARGANEDEPYGERWWEEFLANTLQEIVPLNLIPVVKDIWSIALATIQGDYMQSSRIDLEVYSRLGRAVTAVKKMFESGDVTYSSIYKILTALSSLTGIGISNLVRDVVAIWNVIVGDIGGGPMVK